MQHEVTIRIVSLSETVEPNNQTEAITGVNRTWTAVPVDSRTIVVDGQAATTMRRARPIRVTLTNPEMRRQRLLYVAFRKH